MSKIKSEIHDVIVECIRGIQLLRRAGNRMPDHAMVINDDLPGKLSRHCSRLEFYIALGELTELGRIETGRTINDTYVRVIE